VSNGCRQAAGWENTMKWRALPLAVAAMLSATVPAIACKGKNVFFHDGFTATDPGWGLYDKDTVIIGNSSLRLTPAPQHYAFIYYRGAVYDQADVCVDVALQGGSTVPDGDGGLVFASEDYVGFYYFWISLKNGTAGIRQWSASASKYVIPVAPQRVQLNTGPTVKNTLRVTVDGGRTAGYINDRLFTQLAIKPTEVGGFFGLGAARVDNNPASWIFTNFAITNLP
jgi:hypothetical protein